MKRFGVIGGFALLSLIGLQTRSWAHATFLAPSANDTSDSTVIIRVDPKGFNYNSWQVSVTLPGMPEVPATHPYPTGFNSLSLTTDDSGSAFIPNTSYLLKEQLSPAIDPAHFTFWTRPTDPGRVPNLMTIGCGYVQVSFRNSGATLANPPGTAYREDLYYSSFCGADVHPCATNEYDYSLFQSTTVYSTAGANNETLTATFTGLDAHTVYHGWLTVLSGSGDSALNNLNPIELPLSFDIDSAGSGFCSKPTPFLNRIEVLPPNQLLLVGQTQVYTALGFDQFGHPYSFPNPLMWSITDSHNNPVPGAIDANGLFTAPNILGGYFVNVKTLDSNNTTVTGFTNVNVVNHGHTNQPPVALIHLTPSSGAAPLNVALDGRSSYDPDGQIVAYQWDLGTLQGQAVPGNLTHLYATPGSYTITLTVTDDKGATASTSTVLIVSPPVTSPPTSPNPNGISTSIVARVYPRTISPNGDGINDAVFFELNNPDQKSVHGEIFDIQAAHVADLKPGKTLGSSFVWDGKDDNHRIVPGGIYIYQIEVGGDRFNGTVTVVK
jgi:hypothetical protein